MADGIDMELALELSEAICRSGGTELSDLIYVAKRLKTADDLKNVRAAVELKWPKIQIAVMVDYSGPFLFWNRGDIGSIDERRHEESILDYFKDLSTRTGLAFQKFGRISGTSGPTINSKGFCKFYIETIVPSGKQRDVILTQHYTYEQAELARQTKIHQ